MDFSVLLETIRYMITVLFTAGLITAWCGFAVITIKNHVLSMIIAILPVVTLLSIMKYHMLVNS